MTSLPDRDQTPESLMQNAQIRLSEIVSDRKMTPSTYKVSHTLTERQSLMVAPCKFLHKNTIEKDILDIRLIKWPMVCRC